MRVLMLVFAGIAVVAGIVSGQLWRELRAERQENANLRTQLNEARLPGRQPLPARLASAPQAATAPVSASTAPVPVTEVSQGATARQQMTAINATAMASLSALTSSLGVSSDQELMKDPEFRKARLTQLRIQLARSYPGLAEELALSEREANQLFELIAENQLKTTAEITSRATTGTQDVAATSQRLQAQARELEESIRATLGSGRYAQWQAYQETRPARTQVVTLGNALSAAGQPLTSAQSRALTSVMIAEQQRQRQQPPPPPPQINSTNPQTRTAQILEDNLNRQAENNRRILEAAAPHLNTAQLAAMREQHEQQNATRRSTLTRLQQTELRLQEAIPPRP